MIQIYLFGTSITNITFHILVILPSENTKNGENIYFISIYFGINKKNLLLIQAAFIKCFHVFYDVRGHMSMSVTS